MPVVCIYSLRKHNDSFGQKRKQARNDRRYVRLNTSNFPTRQVAWLSKSRRERDFDAQEDYKQRALVETGQIAR